jgi:hypothetical protein
MGPVVNRPDKAPASKHNAWKRLLLEPGLADNRPDKAPASKHNGGSPRWQISGLNHTAFGLAVSASQWKLPATTPDSLPVTGPQQPGGIRTRRVPTKGFRMVRFFPLS